MKKKVLFLLSISRISNWLGLTREGKEERSRNVQKQALDKDTNYLSGQIFPLETLNEIRENARSCLAVLRHSGFLYGTSEGPLPSCLFPSSLWGNMWKMQTPEPQLRLVHQSLWGGMQQRPCLCQHTFTFQTLPGTTDLKRAGLYLLTSM